MDKYLRQGDQTRVTPNIKRLAEKLQRSNNLETIFSVLVWIDKNIERESNPEVFRTRTSDQILTDKYATGCTDFALLYIAISRALQFPTKYVELLSKDWLSSNEEFIQGHVIAEVNVGEEWLFVDPTRGSVSIKATSGMIVYDKGLDSWDLGIRNGDDVNDRFYKFREEHKDEFKKK